LSNLLKECGKKRPRTLVMKYEIAKKFVAVPRW
jgi:hypothetical protein